MGTVLLLGLAAAVYPQLLAVVVVILTRPNPRPLLWACYLGSLVVNVACGILVLVVFRSSDSMLGTSSRRLGPAAYLLIGVVAVIVAGVVATSRGRELIGRDRPVLRGRTDQAPGDSRVGRVKARAEVALTEGSLAAAVAAGALLAIPGPFDFFAIGHLARNGYPALVAGGAIVVFALVKFLLIEIPILSYAISPEETSEKVNRFSNWMHAHKMTVVACVVALIGIALIAKGISAL